MIEIAHQRRAGLAAGDVLGRAAHVDVDDVGAGGLGDPRALGHPVRFAAGELHDMRADARSPRMRSRDIGRPWTSSSLAVISETTSPAPSAAASRRNGASVMPDIGARSTRLAISISPIFNGLASIRPVTDFSIFWQRHIATAGSF